MRIAILTQPLRYNYGGILQNFALQTVLRRMGHKVVTLDPNRYEYSWGQHVRFIIQHAIGKYILGHQYTKILDQWDLDRKIRILGKNTFAFIDNYIKRKEYHNLSIDVKDNNYDAFIVGSDQVWRPEYNTNIGNMFLNFTESWNVKRIAYAASFGVSEWKGDERTTATAKRMLPKFNMVSVREEAGVDICKNIFGINAQHVLDPTLFLTKEDYISLLHLNSVPKCEGNLLVYILDYTDDKRSLIDRLAADYKLAPFRVNSSVEDWHAALEDRIQPPVEQWLRGFMDTDYVITDSFHACVFSIIFEKPFTVVANCDRGIARLHSLLSLFGLENRLVFGKEESPAIPTTIDWQKVRQRRTIVVEHSLRWISEALT